MKTKLFQQGGGGAVYTYSVPVLLGMSDSFSVWEKRRALSSANNALTALYRQSETLLFGQSVQM